MNVYTYTGDSIIPEDPTGKLPKKNCRIKINFPSSMSESVAESLISSIKSKSMSDILLYGAVSFVSSGEDSQLFPASDYILLSVPAKLIPHIDNVDNSAFLVYADGTQSIYVLDVDSVLHCITTGDYIIKDGDSAILRPAGCAVSTIQDTEDTQDWVIAL